MSLVHGFTKTRLLLALRGPRRLWEPFGGEGQGVYFDLALAPLSTLRGLKGTKDWGSPVWRATGRPE